MNRFSNEPHVIPRPVDCLPEYANARSRHSLAERLVDVFSLSDVSASAIANAVVNPTDVRKSIGDPADPEAEKIPVPGGTLLGVRTSVWARRIMPDPRNPRTLPSRRHPFAIEPGSGGEDSKFRPIPEPRLFDSEEPHRGELVVDIESRHHLTWAVQQAAGYVLAENDWRMSIASQGVMEAVWVVATDVPARRRVCGCDRAGLRRKAHHGQPAYTTCCKCVPVMFPTTTTKRNFVLTSESSTRYTSGARMIVKALLSVVSAYQL